MPKSKTAEREWFWTLSSEVFGTERFGGYDTEAEALAGIKRVKAGAKRLNDGIERTYSAPFQEE
jgi:hypothetical protein